MAESLDEMDKLIETPMSSLTIATHGTFLSSTINSSEPVKRVHQLERSIEEHYFMPKNQSNSSRSSKEEASRATC